MNKQMLIVHRVERTGRTRESCSRVAVSNSLVHQEPGCVYVDRYL